MALDESKETDTVVEIEGFTYVIDKDFLEKVQPVKVDYSPMGFRVNCAVDFGGGGCSSCGSGSCG